MPKFRKKPVVIEAEQFNNGIGRLPFQDVLGVCCLDDTGQWYIHTLEGDMNISDGDWIIKGVAGEYYPCKPDIFEQTYESVDD